MREILQFMQIERFNASVLVPMRKHNPDEGIEVKFIAFNLLNQVAEHGSSGPNSR